MATHSSILAWRIPWTEKPGRLQPMVSQRVGHDRTHTCKLIIYNAVKYSEQSDCYLFSARAFGNRKPGFLLGMTFQCGTILTVFLKCQHEGHVIKEFIVKDLFVQWYCCIQHC